MGNHVNPGNEGFQKIRNSLYVDKTGLISYFNETMNSFDNMTCISRPRRFGKSYAARMLCAYYDKSCDSRSLFADLEIGKSNSFEKYLNKYDVLYLDITWFIALYPSDREIVSKIQRDVIQELKQYFPGCISDDETALQRAIFQVAQATGDKFFVIIDEWDALFREAKNDTAVQKEYVMLLRGLFKGGPSTDKSIAGAYMTGILPIKKYGTESALTDFKEFTMVNPAKLSRYVGFTEEEVKKLCDAHGMDFSGMERWYDGYSFNRTSHVYSPNSVINAIKNEEFRNYWTKTEAFESLTDYISMNFDGLKDAIIAMMGGQRIMIDTLSFQNDLINLESRDDVLTLLVHLGYLAYDEEEQEVYIPNLEVSDSIKLAVQKTGWNYVAAALMDSKKLLLSTLAGDSVTVANALDGIHMSSSSVLQYNNENSLACALTIAYYTAKSDYTIIRELPTGKGFADLAFIPRKHTSKPAMIVELKFDQTADTAIRQIEEKRYGGELKDYAGDLLLVGVNYDKETKTHSCVIKKH